MTKHKLKLSLLAPSRFGAKSFVEPLENRQMLSTVAVFPTSPLQTIESLGGNYALGQFTGQVTDTIGDYTLKNLNPKMIHVPLFLPEREPANDNANPSSVNAAGFKDSGKVHNLFL